MAGGEEDGEEGLHLPAALYTVKWEAGQVGVLVRISAARAAHRHERGNRHRLHLAEAVVLTSSVKRERVTEIIAKTVALRTVADVAVVQDTMGLVVNKVSLNPEFISRNNHETNC